MASRGGIVEDAARYVVTTQVKTPKAVGVERVEPESFQVRSRQSAADAWTRNKDADALALD